MDYINMDWFVVEDDVTGGWAVATVDAPVSSFLGYGTGRTVCDGIWDRAIAEHIVLLHQAQR